MAVAYIIATIGDDSGFHGKEFLAGVEHSAAPLDALGKAQVRAMSMSDYGYRARAQLARPDRRMPSVRV